MIVVDGPPGWNVRIALPDHELMFTYARSGGSGGQNVNKVSSKATLRWSFDTSEALPPGVRARFLEAYRTRITESGDVLVVCDRHRDQGRNAAECAEKLADMIRAVMVPPKPRRDTKPTRGSKERRLRAKRTRAATKAGRGRIDDD